MITLSFKEAIKEVKRIRGIDISIEDIWDKILDNKIKAIDIKDELRLCYNHVLFYFNPEMFTIISAKDKRKKFVEENYKALWDKEMVGEFESEEDDFDELDSPSTLNYQSDLWDMRSKNVYLRKGGCEDEER